jgi:HSP20 family molecular chaperone IbpA
VPEAVAEEVVAGPDVASVEAAGAEVAAAVVDARACLTKGAGVDKAATDVAAAAATLDHSVDALGEVAAGAVVSAQRTGLRASVDSFVAAVPAWTEEPTDEDVIELVASRLTALAADATKLVGGVRKAVAKAATGSGAASRGGSAVAPKATSSSGASTVSSMVETADKSAYELVYDTLGTNKAAMTLSSLGGRTIRFAEVETIQHDASKVENRTHVRNYQLPFRVDSSLLEAHFVVEKSQLRVVIPKSAEIAEDGETPTDDSQYGVLLSFKTKGVAEASTESVDMEVTQTADAVVVTIAPARADEEVTVTVGKDSLDVEAVRTVEETREDGSTVITKKTVTDTLSLPFPLSRDAVTVSLLDEADELAGRKLVLEKPRSKAIDPKEEGDIISISYCGLQAS